MDGKILWRNASFNVLFAFLENDVITIKDICPEVETVGAVIKTLLDGYCENIKMDKRYKRKDGSIFWGRVAISLARDSDGLPLAFFVCIEDITASREKSMLLKGSLGEMEAFLLEKISKKHSI